VSELKPCPFCGAPARAHGGSKSASVICSGGECFVDPETTARTVQEAIDRWNTRATPPRAEVDVELASRAIDNAILLASVYDGVAIDGNKVIADLAALRRALSRATGGA